MSDSIRVDISRPLAPVKFIHGVPLVEDSGLNYVDVFFPDKTQRVWGYIGRPPKKGDQFSPLAGCKQSLADAIQAEINKQLGCSDDEAAAAPVMIEDEVIDGDEEELTEDDDE